MIITANSAYTSGRNSSCSYVTCTICLKYKNSKNNKLSPIGGLIKTKVCCCWNTNSLFAIIAAATVIIINTTQLLPRCQCFTTKIINKANTNYFLNGRKISRIYFGNYQRQRQLHVSHYTTVSPFTRLEQRPIRMTISDKTLQDDNAPAAAAADDDDTEAVKRSNPLVEIGLPSPLILGSASFTRKLILKEMGIDYNIVVRPIDEKNIGNRDLDPPDVLVTKLAKAKMDHLIKQIMTEQYSTDIQNWRNNEFVVLTADQVVTCNGRILEKAQSIDEAIEFVQLYGTYPCTTVGAVVMTHVPTYQQVCSVHVATIYFNSQITNDAANLIYTLINSNEPILSCAGALMIEHPIVQKYIHHLDGTQDSIMGLSKETVLTLLQQLKDKITAT